MFQFRLKELRGNMSQADLATALNISRGAVGLWETGERQPKYETLIKIADLFNCSVDYLIGHKENDNVNNGLIVPAEKKQVVTELLALPKQYFDFIATEIQTCLKLSQSI